MRTLPFTPMYVRLGAPATAPADSRLKPSRTMLLSTAWSSSHGSGPTVSMRRAHSLVKASAASVERK